MEKTKLKKIKITLHGRYDQDKTATVIADYNGYDYYISNRQYTSAMRRARIIDGDYLIRTLKRDGTDGRMLIEGKNDIIGII